MTKDSHKNRVGFFVSSDSWINHQQWHHEVSRALYGRGYAVSIIAPKGSKLYSKSKRYGIPFSRFKKRIFLLTAIIELIKILRRESISTLFINHPKDLRKAAVAARLAGVKKIIYRRGTVSPVKRNLINKWIFNRMITEVITNSDANRDVMIRKKPKLFHKEKINVIYNGLDISKFDEKNLAVHNFRKNGEVIIGLLTGHFNKDRFIQLIRMINRDSGISSHYRFLIYGNKHKNSDLIKRLKGLGVKGKLVHWDSRSKNLLDFMNSIDVFMSGYLRHSFNYPVLYAMALNKPVIGYNVGSNPEMIRDNSNGFLLKSGDLQGAIKKLEALTDDQLRKRLGEEGRKTVRSKFNFQQSIDQIEELIEQ
ncbi:MAG: glycosyltransferase family 4 protein [Bacteroidales bacterium]